MNLRKNYELAKLTEKVLSKGLDYRVTLGSNVTVELLHGLTGRVLATKVSETVEDALFSLLEGVE